MKLTIKPIDVTAIDSFLNKNGEAARQALKATTNDLRRRVPGMVATNVRTRYNIKKSDITPGKSKGRKAGRISLYGDTVDNLQFVYSGKRLSVARFAMKPEKPEKPKLDKKGRKVFKPITVMIKKGKRKKLSSKKAFLAPTGTYGTAKENYQYIPFERKGRKRYPIEAVRTVSMPQMVKQEEVAKLINEGINDVVTKRLTNNVRRFLNKS